MPRYLQEARGLLTATGGTSYQWSRNGTRISGATAATYSATLAGTYSVLITNNGCSCRSVEYFKYYSYSITNRNDQSSQCHDLFRKLTVVNRHRVELLINRQEMERRSVAQHMQPMLPHLLELIVLLLPTTGVVLLQRILLLLL